MNTTSAVLDEMVDGHHTLDEVEKDLIVHALGRADQNQTKAAMLLGISRYALRYRADKFQIPLVIGRGRKGKPKPRQHAPQAHHV